MAQNAHPMPQPACVLAHTESLPWGEGMPTHSTETPSPKASRYFRLPSTDTWRATSVVVPSVKRSSSWERSAAGTLVISSKRVTPFFQTQSATWLARHDGTPRPVMASVSCSRERERMLVRVEPLRFVSMDMG